MDRVDSPMWTVDFDGRTQLTGKAPEEVSETQYKFYSGPKGDPVRVVWPSSWRDLITYIPNKPLYFECIKSTISILWETD